MDTRFEEMLKILDERLATFALVVVMSVRRVTVFEVVVFRLD
jgi:hypothetical protein